MDHNKNIHLEIAKALLDERQLAQNLSMAIYHALDALDAQLQRMVQEKIIECECDYSDEELQYIKLYCKDRINKLMVLAGIYTFNPNGCSGEQTYKFIQEFTQVSSVKTKTGNTEHAANFKNYTQGQFNSLTDDSESEDYYNEKAYHEFTASGGCRD